MKTVVFDIGHGGNGNLTSYGAAGNGLREKDLVLKMGKWAEEMLAPYDCRVKLTRKGDYDVSFSDRANMARGADIFVSLHFNGHHMAGARGFETFVFNGTLKPETQWYQSIIHSNIYSYLRPLGTPDRGKKQANFAMLRIPPCPAVLIEYLFVTNPHDAAIAGNEKHLKEMTWQTVKGVLTALDTPVKEAKGRWLYRIIVNSYDRLENAEEEYGKIQRLSPSLNPFIVYNDVGRDYFYRVVAGEYDSEQHAKEVKNWLEQRGQDSFILVVEADIIDELDLPFPEEPEPPEIEPAPEDNPGIVEFLQKLIKLITEFLAKLN